MAIQQMPMGTRPHQRPKKTAGIAIKTASAVAIPHSRRPYLLRSTERCPIDVGRLQAMPEAGGSLGSLADEESEQAEDDEAADETAEPDHHAAGHHFRECGKGAAGTHECHERHETE